MLIIISDGLPNITSDERANCQAPSSQEMDTFLASMGSVPGMQPATQHDSVQDLNLMFRNIRASESALREAKISRQRSIELSFLYIQDTGNDGEALARKIARVGNGTYSSIAKAQELPGKALQLI